MEILKSQIDSSVNFTFPQPDGGHLEARYVRRKPEYVTAYLSSHSGCAKACKFCHLTQSGQTMYTHATLSTYLEQASTVLAHYQRENIAAKAVYYSFMARGEALANKTVLNDGDRLLYNLGELASEHHLASRFCLSTIMPREMKKLELVDIFRHTRPMIYYSLYSLNDAFRAKWMPQAMDPYKALEKLKRWQDLTGMLVKIHGTVIKGENDSVETWEAIEAAIYDVDLHVAFNLVPYNPYNADAGEPGNLENINEWLQSVGYDSQVKTRIGPDVKASCGMFVEANSEKGD